MYLSTGITLYHASSSAYIWQQGARLFWVVDDTFVFNNYQDDTKSFNACVVDLKKPDGTFMLDRPVYDCRNGMFISLDFSRLAAAGSEYGYYNGSPEKYDLYDLQNDGVFLGSLSTGKSEQILSLERIANCGTGKWHSETIHTVNHLMFNPSGSAFVFIHRYYSKGKKSDRLMHYKISDDLLTVLSDHNMVSHYGWKNDAEMICYMRRFDAGDRYYHIDCESKVIKVFSRTDVFSGRDGHPSFCVNRLVFDTYPDKARIKDLYIYDAEKEMITVAGSFYESLDYYDATRCDLHPRWGSSCGEVFFDSVHEGRRRLYSMKVNQLKHP